MLNMSMTLALILSFVAVFGPALALLIKAMIRLS
jgi:hypothetical protein